MSARGTDQTYYQILEITPGAPHHEVVAAYQKAKEAYSPASPALYTIFTPEEAEELRKLVEEAFMILGNQNKRKEYDQILLSRSPQPTARDLPDFAPPDANPDKPKSVSPNAGDKSAISVHAVPDGFVKGRFSVYERNNDLEKEISEQKDFTGEFLRRVRQYKNINLDQLSKETRISRTYLLAIETEDASALPAPVFLRGFVIQLARILGLNETAVATSYMSRIKKGSSE